MHTFLEAAEDLLVAQPATWRHHQAFKDALQARARLQRLHSKAEFDVRNLEAIFGAFEMASLLNIDLGAAELPDKLRTVIAITLEDGVRFRSQGARLLAPVAYASWASLCAGLVQQLRHRVTVLTFNYDVCADVALWLARLSIDYCVGDVVRETDDVGEVQLLKLHGSLNWVRCVADRTHLLVRLPRDIVRDMEASPGFPAGPFVKIPIIERLGTLDHCARRCDPVPVIVPPTLHKSPEHSSLASVWTRAAQALREADNIFISGYSWPQNDTFFHFLFALGAEGPKILRKFWVFDLSESVRVRYRDALIGAQVKNCFAPADAMRFENSNNEIAGALGVAGVHTGRARA